MVAMRGFLVEASPEPDTTKAEKDQGQLDLELKYMAYHRTHHNNREKQIEAWSWQ